MIITRRADEHDLESLTFLFNEYRLFYKKETDLQGCRRFIAERIANNESVIFVAENSDLIIVGFVQLYPLFSSTRLKRLWLLNDLFIQPEFRSKGISTALINASKTLCLQTGGCGILLETAKDNVIGNNLYRKTGFSLDSGHHYYEWEAGQEPG